LSSLFSEFRRRNVFRVAALYLVSAWLIAQVAEVVIGLGEFPPAIGRLVLIILALGFPVAVVIAWFFEWTAGGIRRETEADAVAAANQPARRRMDYVILALLLVALGYFAATHDWRGPPPVVGASVAVLPFENLSAQPDDLYFTDGIHEDILARLGRIGALMVISRTSIMQYRHTGKTIPEIAAELGVASILEGSVQRAGNRVRIQLQLIDAAERSLWSESYDRELTAENVFAIQSEVAASIADALQAQLLPAERRSIDAIPTHNLEAYDAYLLGRRHLAARRAGDMVQARAYFERAVKLDPTFALAYSGLADTLLLFTVYGPREANTNSAIAGLIADAETAARRALELNPDLGEAHTSYGLVMLWKGDPPTDYGPSLQRGVELAPNSADARKWYAGYLAVLNRKDEALQQYLKAAELDPMSPIIRLNLSSTLWDLGRQEEAKVQSKRALEIDPDLDLAQFSDLESDDLQKNLLALSQLFAPKRADPRLAREFALDYLTLGDSNRAEQWAAETERLGPDSVAALIARLNVSVFVSQYAAAREAANRMLDYEAAVTFPSRVLLTLDLRENRLEDAMSRYRQWYPALLGDDPEVGDKVALATDVAMLYRAMGEPEKADQLLALGLQKMAMPREGSVGDYGTDLARLYAQTGQVEMAITTLRETIDAGWNFQWWFYLKQDPAFDAVRGDPRFQLLVEEMNAKMARLLEKVRQLEEEGQIALPQDH